MPDGHTIPREPERSDNWPNGETYWFWARNDRWQDADAPAFWLPGRVFSRLPQPPAYANGPLPDYDRVRYYPTREAAVDALRDATLGDSQ